MSLPGASASDLGLDARRLAAADDLVLQGLEDGVYPAAVLLVARHGRIAHASAFGDITDGTPVKTDTVFDLASCTKPVVATTLLTLLEEGRVLLEQTVAEHLPEAKGHPVADLTIRQLATHSSGLPAWKPLYKAGDNHEAMLTEILRTPLRARPGTEYVYSDLGYMLIGEIVSRVAGKSLKDAVHERVLQRLGMNDTEYLPPASLRKRIAPTANCPMRLGRTLIGEVHDANAHFYGGVSGHAGLFGTAPDLAILASALASDGQAGGKRVLGMPTLRLARTSQIPREVGGHSIGWFTPPNGMLPRGDILGETPFGHTGFTGTMVVIDPAWELAIIFLTNRVMVPADNGSILRIRRRIVNAVAASIVHA